MSESTVIKEFLVALGFSMDETAAKKFRESIGSATAAVVRLGAVIETTALAVSVGVARWAGSLEQLYFAAQRTNSSADQLQAFGLAARNFGASVDEALSSVEGLAAFMRNNPGGENFIASLLGSVGLSAKDANGHIFQGTALMAQIGKMFAVMRANNQTFRAEQIAGQLGISDKTMLAMSSPGFADEEARQERRAKGWQKTAAAAHAFMIQLENLKMQFQQMLLGFEGPAMAALQRLMGSFSRFIAHHGRQAINDLVIAFDWLIAGMGRLLVWLDAHGGEIQKRIADLFGQVAKTAAIVKPALEFVYNLFVKLDEVTGGWSTNLLAVAATLKLLGAGGLISGLIGMAAALRGAVAATAAASAGTGALATLASGVVLGGAAVTGAGLGALFDKLFPNNWLAQFGGFLGNKAADLHDWQADTRSAKNANDPSRWYETHYPWDAPPARAGSGGAGSGNGDRTGPVSFKTDIHIDGAEMGKRELAQAVADMQARVNSQLIREFSAVVQ